jgi:NADH-quinone oxidoreductase subunit D
VGGVKRDIPIGWADRLRAKIKLFEHRIDEYEMLLDESTIWLVRLQGVGYATAEDQLNEGVSGPNIRAAGVNTDARWTNPYSVYDQVDWEPAVEKPTSVKGADCYDRYRVRMEEMRQSCRMILDAIEKIPGGSNTHYSPGDEMILTKAPTRAPEGATGTSTYECTRGVSQFYLQGGGDGRGKHPYRVSIRSPMFITIPYVAKTMIGYKVADIPAIMGSFDPCIGETDR